MSLSTTRSFQAGLQSRSKQNRPQLTNFSQGCPCSYHIGPQHQSTRTKTLTGSILRLYKTGNNFNECINRPYRQC